MALSDSQIEQIRFELGHHILRAGAAPYITDRSLFAQVIQPNVEGVGEQIVVDLLDRIQSIKDSMAPSATAGSGSATLAGLLAGAGALKKVDEIEFHAPPGTFSTNVNRADGGVQFSNLKAQLNYWRDELASALGVENMWNVASASPAQLEAY